MFNAFGTFGRVQKITQNPAQYIAHQAHSALFAYPALGHTYATSELHMSQSYFGHLFLEYLSSKQLVLLPGSLVSTLPLWECSAEVKPRRDLIFQRRFRLEHQEYEGWSASSVIAWLHCTPHIAGYKTLSSEMLERAAADLVRAFDFACDQELACRETIAPSFYLETADDLQKHFRANSLLAVYQVFENEGLTKLPPTSPWLGLYVYLHTWKEHFKTDSASSPLPGEAMIKWLLDCHHVLVFDEWEWLSYRSRMLQYISSAVQRRGLVAIAGSSFVNASYVNEENVRLCWKKGFILNEEGILSYFPQQARGLVQTLLLDRFLQAFEQSVDESLLEPEQWRDRLLQLLKTKKLLNPADFSDDQPWELQDLIVLCCTRGAEQVYRKGSPVWRDGLLTFLRKKELLSAEEVSPFQGKSLDPQALAVACGEHQLQKLYQTQVPRWESQVVDFLQRKAFLTDDEAKAFSSNFDAPKIALACVRHEVKKTFLQPRGLYVAGAVATYLGVTAADLAVRKGLEGCAHWIWRSAHF